MISDSVHRTELPDRTQELFQSYCGRAHRWADSLFGYLLIGQWLLAIVVALWVSPQAWAGSESTVHTHVWLAVFLGGAIVSLPVWMTQRHPGQLATRLLVGVAQALLSGMFIHLTGGRIETHFHVFCSLAVLAIYRDWRVMIVASVTVLADHLLRGALAPLSVFGVAHVNVWRSFEHAGWAAVEDVFLILAGNFSLQETLSHARREAELQGLNELTEQTVTDRTGELRSSVARTRSILDAALDAIVSIDAKGRILEFNPAAEAAFGYPAAEVYGQSLSTMLLSPEGPAEQDGGIVAFFAIEHEAIVGRRVEVEAIHRDGHRFPVEIAVVAVGTLHPTFTAFIRDISERRQVEDSQLKAKQQAEEASLAKSQFLASMSHELRTPLNGVIGMTELLISTSLDDRQMQFVRACQNSGRTLLELINDILDVSKIEAGKLELDHHDFDLEQLIRDTTDMIWLRAQEKGLELICEFDRHARQIYSGDSTRLRQILVNLLSNAEKFTDRGEIVLGVSLVERDNDVANLRFSVRDTGIGIPPDRAHRLFQSFSQVDSSTTRKYGGTGLGLAICKHLVNAMGGEIGVDSQVGEGTTFWFTLALPVREGCDLQSGQDSTSFAGCRVLVVDDNATNRLILEEQTRGWGMLPETASCVDEALRRLQHAKSAATPFDLVISDYHMPDKSGVDLARQLQCQGDMPPFILLGSSIAESSLNDTIQSVGIRQQLTKPVLSTQLYTAIHSVLQSQKSQAVSVDQGQGGLSTHPVEPKPSFKGELLVAEDNAVNTLYVTSLLNQAGYTTQTASNGLQAVLAVRSQHFALVLMDCQMPELDGYEATRCIRNLEQKGRLTGHVPIIALTANAIKGDAERCLEAGMDAYLSKPFEPHQLLRLVEKLSRPVEINSDLDEFSDDMFGAVDQPSVPEPDSVSSSQQPLNVSPPGDEFGDAVPPIDADALLNRCMGSVEFMESLLSELESSGTGHVDDIDRGLQQNDARQTADAAHALKGAAGILSAEPVRRLAADIEQSAKSGTLDGLEATIIELRSQMDRCLKFIPSVKRTARQAEAKSTLTGKNQ